VPDKPFAQCPDCGCLFEPQEMKRGEPSEKSRIRIRRSADTLEIIQNPLRTGLPLWTILACVLFDLGVAVIILCLTHLFPGENIWELLRTEDDTPMLARWIGTLLVLHTLILPFPLWAFFDQRTLRIDREKMIVRGRWFLFPWKRTASRLQVRKASRNVWDEMIYNIRVGYSNRFVWIGCSSRQEAEMLRGEINHFLYTVEPVRLENASDDSTAAFLGGSESLDPAITLHCPYCGANVAGQSLDFPAGTAHCTKCQTAFPIENAVVYLAVTAPENIPVERTDDSLTMRYVPDDNKGTYYILLALYCLGMLVYGGLFVGLAVHCILEGNTFFLIFASATFFLLMGIAHFGFINDMNAFFCDWTIHLDRNEARFELRCKKHRKTVVIPREKIIEACPNKSENLFRRVRLGRFPEFLCSPGINGGHFLLDDGTKHYLPLGTMDARKRFEVREWMLAVLNEFLVAR
jgi:hypothetical protein